MDVNLVEWYYNYITHRNLEYTDDDFKIEGTIGLGFPQGGVCLAKFWIIAFNYALEIINTPLTAVSYTHLTLPTIYSV